MDSFLSFASMLPRATHAHVSQFMQAIKAVQRQLQIEIWLSWLSIVTSRACCANLDPVSGHRFNISKAHKHLLRRIWPILPMGRPNVPMIALQGRNPSETKCEPLDLHVMKLQTLLIRLEFRSNAELYRSRRPATATGHG